MPTQPVLRMDAHSVKGIEEKPLCSPAIGPVVKSGGVARMTILVGFAEALSGPEVVWSLADEGFRVMAFARRGHRSALCHSRYVTVHEVTPPEIVRPPRLKI